MPEPVGDHVQGRPLVAHEQHPLAAAQVVGDHVRDRLALARARRPVDDQRPAVAGQRHGPGLARVGGGGQPRRAGAGSPVPPRPARPPAAARRSRSRPTGTPAPARRPPRPSSPACPAAAPGWRPGTAPARPRPRCAGRRRLSSPRGAGSSVNANGGVPASRRGPLRPGPLTGALSRRPARGRRPPRRPAGRRRTGRPRPAPSPRARPGRPARPTGRRRRRLGRRGVAGLLLDPRQQGGVGPHPVAGLGPAGQLHGRRRPALDGHRHRHERHRGEDPLPLPVRRRDRQQREPHRQRRHARVVLVRPGLVGDHPQLAQQRLLVPVGPLPRRLPPSPLRLPRRPHLRHHPGRLVGPQQPEQHRLGRRVRQLGQGVRSTRCRLACGRQFMFGPDISPANSRSNIVDNTARPGPAMGGTVPAGGRATKVRRRGLRGRARRTHAGPMTADRGVRARDRHVGQADADGPAGRSWIGRSQRPRQCHQDDLTRATSRWSSRAWPGRSPTHRADGPVRQRPSRSVVRQRRFEDCPPSAVRRLQVALGSRARLSLRRAACLQGRA